MSKNNKQVKTVEQSNKESVPVNNAPTNTALVPAARLGVFANLVSVASAEGAAVLEGYQRIGIPDVLPIKDMQAGMFIEGTAVKIVDSPVKEYNTKLLQLKHTSGQEFCFPIGTVLEGKIKAIGGEDKLIGRQVLIKKVGEKPSKRFSAKSYNVFDFFIKDAGTPAQRVIK